MTRRSVAALAVCAAILLILPWIIGNEFYVNMASQVLIYALFALSINMMLGYGGMVSLGHAGYLGIAGYACILADHRRLRPAHRGDPRGRCSRPRPRRCSACCRCARRASASS